MTIENVDAALSVDEYAQWNADQLQRRGVSRRSVLKGGAGVAALLAAQYAAVDSAFAAAGGVRQHPCRGLRTAPVLRARGRRPPHERDGAHRAGRRPGRVAAEVAAGVRRDRLGAGAVRPSPDGSVVDTAVDGAVYYTIGSGGRPRYSFQPAPGTAAPAPAGVSADEAQALPEGQRYRGYAPPGGKNATENNTENVVNSYYWSFEGTKVNASGYRQGTKVPESIEWSQVRYLGYAFIAVDVRPAHRGRETTMTIRTLADALPGTGLRYVEIDELTLRRRAGAGRIA